MTKILVTGGAGFIGSHVVDALVQHNHQVFVLDNLSGGKKQNLNPKVKFVHQDIADPIIHIFAQEKFEYVFHLAAQMNVRVSLQDPMLDAKINILGSLNIIDACIKHKTKIIFSSTGGAIYAPQALLPCAEDSLKEPESPYGLAKFTVENYLRVIHNIHGLQYCALRYSNVYGPRQNSKGEAGVIAIFIEKLLRNESPTIFGNGEQTRDFVYVRDVVDANLLAMNLQGSFNVASNTQVSVNELAQEIVQLTGASAPVLHGPAIKGELMHSRLSFDKIKKEGWTPKYLLKEGLKETVEWFKEK